MIASKKAFTKAKRKSRKTKAKTYAYTAQFDGVPAVLVITSDAKGENNAIGAAFLVADKFCKWAINQLKAKK